MKNTIASRATKATNGEQVFFKSYIKNIKLAEVRDNGCNEYNSEKDYFFDYKGRRYRVNAHRQGGVYSADFDYSLEEII